MLDATGAQGNQSVKLEMIVTLVVACMVGFAGLVLFLRCPQLPRKKQKHHQEQQHVPGGVLRQLLSIPVHRKARLVREWEIATGYLSEPCVKHELHTWESMSNAKIRAGGSELNALAEWYEGSGPHHRALN